MTHTAQRRRNWWVKQWDRDNVLSRHHAPGPFEYVLVLDRLKAGYNVPKILRSANVLGAREVHLCGIREFDPSPAKGALRHTRTVWFGTALESITALLAQDYTVYAMHMEGTHVLGKDVLPKKSAFVMGHEEWGFSFELDAVPGLRTLRIPQFGKVQSMNVSVAASVAAFEWCRQHAPDEAQVPARPGHARF